MVRRKKKLLLFFIMFVCFITQLGWAHWAPDDGHKMHYPQLPDPHGWDVCLRPMMIADDFRCSQTGPITDIHFWISWKDNIVDEVLDWTISIYSANDDGKPGKEIWRLKGGKIALRKEEPSMQGWLCPCKEDIADQTIAENHTWYALVNITEIPEPFVQEEGKIYWLVIRANATIYESPVVQPEVGWKTSLDHFRSPAMWIRWPLTSSIGWTPVTTPDGNLTDMAFVINGKNVQPLEMDFGDADETKCEDDAVKCNYYPTTLARNGARHIINPNIFLGNPFILSPIPQIDPEDDGQPTPGADGDDNDGIDDEEGVILPKSITPGTTVTITVWVSVDGFLDAWIDFNVDGDWDDWGEKIFLSQPVTLGSNTLTFNVPNTISDYAPKETYSRFRFSTKGNLNYYGRARDGEVEDYLVIINPEPQPKLDFGDCPDGDFVPSGYPTLLLNNGARHKINRCVRLGRYIDGERDAFVSMDADGDDLNNIDDEDGVYFGDPIIPGTTVEIKVIASCEGFLNAWLDFNADGDWDDPMEQIFTVEPLAGGVNYLKFDVPPSSYVPVERETYARFRFSTMNSADIGYAGLAEDGEVEDYKVRIEGPQPIFDFGDAPELRCDDVDVVRCNSYPTTLSRNGARHILHSDIYLGNPYTDVVHIDAELDGQPTIPADGDDINGFDDEDGVQFVSPLIPGLPAKVEVMASCEGFLDAWIDFNTDGDWDDFGEHIFASEPVVLGTNYLKFKVPPHPHAIPTNTRTYARFRFSTYGGLRYLGPARNGEVEDYIVKIEEPDRITDLGDAPDSTNSFGDTMTAYTSAGPLPVIVNAHYPTVYRKGSPPYGPIHWNPYAVAYLGTKVTLETEADYGYDQDPVNNIIPPRDKPDLDRGDDGVQIPINLPHCRLTIFQYVVSVIRPVEKLYVNVWLDFNRDGDWDDIVQWPVPEEVSEKPHIAREWAVRNQVLTDLSVGIHKITTPPFRCWHPWYSDDYVPPIWMRITLSEDPADPLTPSVNAVGWGGSGPKRGYWIGETEDYFFVPTTKCIKFADLDCDRKVNIADLAIMAMQWLIEL